MKKLLCLTLALMLIMPFCCTLAQESDELTNSGWTITATSELRPIGDAIDGDINTIWHSNYVAEGSTIKSHDEPPFTIDLNLGSVTEISGIRYYPRQDGSVAGIVTRMKVYVSADGTDYSLVGDSEYTYNATLSDREGRTTKFTANVKALAIRLVITEARSGFGTCAELAVLKSDSALKTAAVSEVKLKDPAKTEAQVQKPQAVSLGDDEIANSGWTIAATSEMRPIGNVLDGDINTIWHSKYTAEGSTITSKDSVPFTIDLKLDKETEISGFRYYPRQDGSVAGIVTKMKVYLSADGTNYTELGEAQYTYNATLSDREGRTTAFTGNVKVKALRFIITEARSDYGTCAELTLIKSSDKLSATDIAKVKIVETKEETKKEEPKKEEPVTAATGENKGSAGAFAQPKADAEYEDDEIPAKSDWYAWASSAMGDPSLALDGDMGTWWHSYYEAKNGSITYHDTNPMEYVITFPEVTEFSGVRYYPRPENQSFSGIFKLVDVLVSDDGETFYPAVEGFNLRYGDGAQAKFARTPCEVVFSANVKAKAVKLVVVDSANGFAVASEIRVLKSDPYLAKTLTASEYNADYENLKLCPIDRKDIKVSVSSEQPYPFENPNDMNSTGIKTIDDDIFSIWHTQFRNADGSTEGFNEKVMPAWISYDLGKQYTLQAVSYMPRGAGFRSGHWAELTISSSDDGVNFNEVDTYVLNRTQYLSFNVMVFHFYTPVTARYIRFDITASTNDAGAMSSTHATAADINFYESEKDAFIRHESEKECYKLVVGSKDISVENPQGTTVKTIDVAPFIVNGTTMIPLRGLFEEMGAEVSWLPDTKNVTVKSPDTEIKFQIENNRVWVGGTRYTCIVAPRIESSRTFIPLRFVSEHMGYKVSWDGETRTITIEK